MADRFDQHAARHRMKLLTDDGDVTLYENRDGVQCPACADPFARLLLTERRAHSFDLAGTDRVCVTHEGDRLVVCAHDG
jgi:PIN domain nuclease of toxin-antitoxin system